jgi:hypothetical protein
MPRVQYLACKHCGSEYTVQRRGNSIGLEPFSEEQFEISRQIAEVERVQGEGCSNVFFWILLVAGVTFCGIGFASRALFDTSIPFIVGWAVSIAALIAASGVLLRMLNSQREERLRLETRQEELYREARSDHPSAHEEEGGEHGLQHPAAAQE